MADKSRIIQEYKDELRKLNSSPFEIGLPERKERIRERIAELERSAIKYDDFGYPEPTDQRDTTELDM